MQQSGRIKRLMAGKGYGFVTGDDNVDRFFHAHDITDGPHFDALIVGQHVTFEDDDKSTRGPRALAVRLLPMSGAVAAR